MVMDVVDAAFYDRIREEYEKGYGPWHNEWAPTLFDQLYSDRTHFIYELLQNAEDACERARSGTERKFAVHFELYPDKLEVRHNGIPFDENDIRGICGIGSASALAWVGQ